MLLLPLRERKFAEVKTTEFIDTIRSAGQRKLLFANAEGHQIHSGYHLTEIKAAVFQTVDCGGQTNNWNETIFQLWVPEDAEDEYMSAEKFIRIFDRVRSLINLDLNADARVEYGDGNFFPSIYSVESISMAPETLTVLLVPPVTTCKARDRRAAAETNVCC